jgi:hypothetical protein
MRSEFFIYEYEQIDCLFNHDRREYIGSKLLDLLYNEFHSKNLLLGKPNTDFYICEIQICSQEVMYIF